jgi:hypothetical protein
MSQFDPTTIQKALISPRWSGLVRVDTTPEALATWDPSLLRHSRVLVPVDVQALYVPTGDTTLFVRLPCALTTPDGQAVEPTPAPLADGTKRDAGVYLHWAAPDSLLAGTLESVPDASRNRLSLPPLPDRWVVLRIVAPVNGTATVVTGWVLEADTAKAVPLDKWPAASATTAASGKTLAKDQITGTVGGSVNWTGVYDAGVNRFGFHDPLTDIATVAPNGTVDSLVTYVVAGWWSDATLDPLDSADTAASLGARLTELAWALTSDEEGGDQLNQTSAITGARRASLGLQVGTRYGSVPAAAAGTFVNEQVLNATVSAKTYVPRASSFADEAALVVATEPRWPRSTLLHGSVRGVPVSGPVIIDQRPDPPAVDLALGHDSDDVAAALAAAGLGVTATADRLMLERVLSAFTGQVLPTLGTPDGLVDIEEHEQNGSYSSSPGGDGTLERLRKGAETGPLSVGRAARSQAASLKSAAASPGLKFVRTRTELYQSSVVEQRAVMANFQGTPPVTQPQVEVQEVIRPAPRYYTPLDPMLGIRGAKRSLRHGGDGRFAHDNRLWCRWPSQLQTSAPGLLDGADYVPSLPNGSIPDEILLLAREAVVNDPYIVPWLAQLEAKRRQINAGAAQKRLAAEAALRYGPTATYDGTTTAFQQATPTMLAAPSSFLARAQVSDQLRRFSLFQGVDPSPVSITAWSQPWIPLWLEWELELRTGTRLDGWSLGQIDFEVTGDMPAYPTQTFRGRCPLHAGTARTLAAGIEEWLKGEEQLDQNNTGEVDAATAAALQSIADAIGNLDVLGATFDGLGVQLLGLPVAPLGVMTQRVGATTVKPPAPIGPPQLLVAGDMRVTRARLVDAFGRTLDLPVERTHIVVRDEEPGPPNRLLLRPRIQRPARWLFRLIDPVLPDIAPGPGDPGPQEANIDQIDVAKMVNPVSGFLLPDHIDQSLEVFDTAGQPVGQLMEDSFGGGALWEIAPGRPGPADAGPGYGLAPQQKLLALISAGMVAADAQARDGKPAAPDYESALSAFLRCIDTTLWTVDTFSQLGNEHIAGLVGRPVAVVRATLRLDISDDLTSVDLSDPAKLAVRQAAYKDLADRAFPVRLGELTRSDDGLLGFFVDDDYAHFHIVDRVIRDEAFDVRRGQGQLNQMGMTVQVPGIKPITHPYIVADDEVLVHPGQLVRLTLLLIPAGRVHLTSGILPRKYLQLAHDWVQPGLSVIAPSARIGPVLLDADQVRLPKISSFPKDQIWTRRTSPSTWKDDPILAATQTALLPDMPSEVQEGYIRIAPAVAPGS